MVRLVSQSTRPTARFIIILLFASLVRFLVFPFTNVTNEGDSVSRIFLSWQWLEHPTFLNYGTWPPLHFYFIATSLYLWFDPLRSPSVFHMLISIATVIPLWAFVRREWGEDGALFVGVAFLFYPLSWQLGFMPTSEVFFAFFIALAMYFLSRARAGSILYAALAGLTMAVAAGVRLEAWALMPLFSILLWGRWKSFFTYGLCAAFFSSLWILNGIAHGLPPTSYLTSTQQWDQQIEGLNEGLNTVEVLRRIFYYPYVLIFAVTVPVAAFCAAGIKTIWTDRKKRAWLIPFFVLLLLFMEQAARGVGGTKARYSMSLAILLLPLSAAAIEKFRDKRWLKPVAVLSIALMIPLSYSRGIWYRIAGPNFPNPVPADLQALPRLKEDPRQIAKIAQQNLSGQDGLLLDFFGRKDFYPWKDTYGVALLTGAHPANIFFMPGGRYQPLDENALDRFLNQHPRGVLLYERESRMIHLRPSNGSTTAAIGRSHLVLQVVNSVKSITIYRYEVL